METRTQELWYYSENLKNYSNRELENLFDQFELILDKAAHSIYLYRQFVHLTPQEFNFLYLTLISSADGGIGSIKIMNEIKAKVGQRSDCTQKYTKKRNKVKLAYRVKDRIKYSIIKAFIERDRQKTEKELKLIEKLKYLEPIKDSKKISKIKSELKDYKIQWYEKNKTNRIFKVRVTEETEWMELPDYPEGYKKLNIENIFKRMIYVDNKTFLTGFKQYTKESQQNNY